MCFSAVGQHLISHLPTPFSLLLGTSERQSRVVGPGIENGYEVSDVNRLFVLELHIVTKTIGTRFGMDVWMLDVFVDKVV